MVRTLVTMLFYLVRIYNKPSHPTFQKLRRNPSLSNHIILVSLTRTNQYQLIPLPHFIAHHPSFYPYFSSCLVLLLNHHIGPYLVMESILLSGGPLLHYDWLLSQVQWAVPNHLERWAGLAKAAASSLWFPSLHKCLALVCLLFFIFYHFLKSC